MGDRKSEDVDVAAKSDPEAALGNIVAPPGSLLAKMLADPRTRPAVLRRIAARRERLAAEADGKDPADVVALDDKHAKHGKHEKKDAPSKHPYGDEHKGEREYHEVHGSASLERKPNSDITDAKVTAGLGVEKHERDGHTEVVDERKAQISVSKADGVNLQAEHAEEIGNEEAGTKSGNSLGVQLAPDNAHVKAGHETSAWDGDDKQKKGYEGSVGIKNGKLDAEIERAVREDSATHATETKQSLGFKEGRGEIGLGKKNITKLGDDKETSTGHDVTVGVGKDSAAIAGNRTTTNEQGTTSKTSLGGEYNWKEGNVSANVNHSVTTKGGASGNVGAKYGVHVESSIEEVDDHTFVVHYVHSHDIGMSAGGGKHGAAVNVGGGSSDFDKGARTFATKKEAEEFKENLPRELKKEPDPRSVDGAMKLEVGESRGIGSGTNSTLGASGTVEGATASVSKHDSDSNEVDVKRVSETMFEVTFVQQDASGHTVGVSGLSTSVSRDTTDDHSRSLTMRFDVSKPEGKRAFEQFCREPRVPPKTGGEIVSREQQKGTTSTEDVGVFGDDDKVKSHTSETTRTEGKKKTEDYEGDQGQEHKAGWLGRHLFSEKDEHSSVQIDARQVNDKVDGYTVTASIGGESGAYNRGKMRHMLDSDEAFDEDKVKRSGEWTMTSDLDAKQIAGMEKYKQRFQGKNQDDKMRGLSQWIADDGMNAIDSMQSDWGVQMSWDLELKGDKNFPGRAGREQLEARIQQYGATLQKNPGGAPAVLAEVQGEIEALQARREAVQTKSNYTDLPDQLRAQQLQLIDREKAALASLSHRAAVESTKNQPGESDGKIALRAHDDKAHAELPGPAQKVAQLRDQIAMHDASVATAHKDNAEADAALGKALKHVDWSKRDAGRRLGESGKLYSEARQLDQQQRAEYLKLDELRLALLRDAGDPQQEATVAQDLVARAAEQAKQASTITTRYYDAAKIQVLITRPEGLAGHDAFWSDVRDSMDTSDFADDIEDAAPSGGGVAADDDDDEPHKKVDMALPTGAHKRH